MKRLALVLVMVGFGVTASPAFGQATRTWVSGVGDDANPCSRTAPCKTFAGAISKTAVDGIIDAMDDGGFGAVTITKSITIDGGGHSAGLLASGGINAVNINVPASDPRRRVVLRGLNIEGNGTTLGLQGVNVIGDGLNTLELENVRIADFSRRGIFVAPTATFPSQMSVLLNNVVVADTGNGADVANGFEVKPSDGTRKVNVLIRNSEFKGSRPGPPGPAVPAGEAGIGIVADTGTHVWLSNTAVFDNPIGLKTLARQGTPGVIDSFCDNQIGGNVDNGTAPNEMCPEYTAAPAPAPTVVTQTLTVKQCIVPKLKGLQVGFTRRLLQAANCALGKVTKKTTTKRSQVGRVISQKTKPGTKLADGTKVKVTVGRR